MPRTTCECNTNSLHDVKPTLVLSILKVHHRVICKEPLGLGQPASGSNAQQCSAGTTMRHDSDTVNRNAVNIVGNISWLLHLTHCYAELCVLYICRATINMEQCSPVREATLSSGCFVVTDVRCRSCLTEMGWQYLKAQDEVRNSK